MGLGQESDREGEVVSWEAAVDPIRADCEGSTEVIVGATDREMSRPAALMH